MARFLFLGQRHGQEPKTGNTVVWWVLLASTLLLTWFLPFGTERIIIFWWALWPVFLVLGISYIVFTGTLKSLMVRIPSIPRGDILVFGENLVHKINWIPAAKHDTQHVESVTALKPRETPKIIALPEKLFGRWLISITLFLLILFELTLLLIDS